MLKSAVIGSGGAGRNMLSTLLGSGIPLYLINSAGDSRFENIFSSKAEIEASISTHPGIKRPLMESERSALSVLRSYDLVFSVSGFGGFYGTAVPIMLTRLNNNVIPVFTLPFSIEGEERMRRAKKAMNELLKKCKWAITLKNDLLLKIAPNATVEGAFRAMNLLVAGTVREISASGLKAEDVLGALHGSVGVGIGYGEGMNRQEKALREALSSPWLEIREKAMVIMKGGSYEDFLWIKEQISDFGAEVSAEQHMPEGGRISLLIIS